MGFLLNDPHEKCNRIFSKHSLLTFTVFEMEGAKFAILWIWEIFIFLLILMGFFRWIPLSEYFQNYVYHFFYYLSSYFR